MLIGRGVPTEEDIGQVYRKPTREARCGCQVHKPAIKQQLSKHINEQNDLSKLESCLGPWRYVHEREKCEATLLKCWGTWIPRVIVRALTETMTAYSGSPSLVQYVKNRGIWPRTARPCRTRDAENTKLFPVEKALEKMAPLIMWGRTKRYGQFSAWQQGIGTWWSYFSRQHDWWQWRREIEQQFQYL